MPEDIPRQNVGAFPNNRQSKRIVIESLVVQTIRQIAEESLTVGFVGSLTRKRFAFADIAFRRQKGILLKQSRSISRKPWSWRG
jgi:hypothetical protein